MKAFECGSNCEGTGYDADDGGCGVVFVRGLSESLDIVKPIGEASGRRWRRLLRVWKVDGQDGTGRMREVCEHIDISEFHN